MKLCTAFSVALAPVAGSRQTGEEIKRKSMTPIIFLGLLKEFFLDFCGYVQLNLTGVVMYPAGKCLLIRPNCLPAE